MNTKKRLLNRKCFRLFSIIVVCSTLAFLGSIYLFYDKQEKYYRFLSDDTVKEYLVDTPVCQIPSRDPWDPSVRSYYHPIDGPYNCKWIPSVLLVKPNGIVSIDTTILELYYGKQKSSLNCTYQAILRNGSVENFTVDNSVDFTTKKNLILDTPLKEEWIRTECIFSDVPLSEQTPFVNYLAPIPLKPEVEARCERLVDNSKRHLNVIFLGIDSISRLNYIRHFPKTRRYLSESERMVTFSLDGYTKVGDNTFPNLVPLLTGQFYEYYWNETTNKTMYFDDVDFLWKKFQERGYRTLLAEDAPRIATFNYFRSGFKTPPTDYYYRPMALALEYSELMENSKKHCFGERMEVEVVYDYLKTFVATMNHSRPFFAFTFVARLTHDVLNYAGYADEPTYRLIRYLDEYDFLNNTALVFYSDHGIRFSGILNTYLGQLEVRMPFVNLILPRWFTEANKDIIKNLRINQHRLTTPFDLHETVLDLLDIDKFVPSQEPVLSYSGISLFNEVSPYRTCEHANITTHWCTCHEQKAVPIDDVVVTEAANVIVRTLNQWTEHLRDKCAVLTLDRILNARSVKRRSNDVQTVNGTLIANLTQKEVYSEFLLVISTNPSGAYFDSTVRCSQGVCSVVDDVERINMYGSQSICIEDTVLKKFCYCY